MLTQVQRKSLRRSVRCQIPVHFGTKVRLDVIPDIFFRTILVLSTDRLKSIDQIRHIFPRLYSVLFNGHFP